jgi:hypothetical protein
MGCDSPGSLYGLNRYPSCSGNGACINDRCICRLHWSSYGDLQLEHGIDCDISIPTIKYWSLINFIISSLAVVITIYCIRGEFYQLRRNQRPFFTRDGSPMFSLYLGFSSIMVSMYSIYKYLDPSSANIGSRSYPQMSVFGLGIVCMNMYAGSALSLIIIKFLRRHLIFINSSKMKQLINTMDWISTLAYIFPTIMSCIFIVIITTSMFHPPSKSDLYLTAYQSVYVVALCSYGFPLIFILNVFTKELNKTLQSYAKLSLTSVDTGDSKSDSIKTLARRYQIIHYFLSPQILFTIPLHTAVLLWYFLRRKFVYVFCLQNSFTSLCALIFIAVNKHFSERVRPSSISMSSLHNRAKIVEVVKDPV